MSADEIQNVLSLQMDPDKGILQGSPLHILRHLSDLGGIYQNHQAYQDALADGNRLVYEMYTSDMPSKIGELQFSIDTIYPGCVGEEYHMTKGHAHVPSDCVELYIGTHGIGLILMETADGRFQSEELYQGQVVYVPAGCIHRTVNTGDSTLSFFTVYPAHARTAYDQIPSEGLKYLAVRTANGPKLIQNPKRMTGC